MSTRLSRIRLLAALLVPALGLSQPLAQLPRRLDGSPQDGTTRVEGTIRTLARGFVPVKGIPVYLTRLPNFPNDRLVLNLTETTDDLGRYSFKNLLPGRYRVCPHVPQTVFLSPCDWDADSHIVSAGISAAGLQVIHDFQFDQGTLVLIAVDDEDNELYKFGAAAGLAITIQGPRGPLPAREGLRLGRRQHWTLLAPKGRPAQLSVNTAIAFRVEHDDQGQRRVLDSRAPTLVLAAGNDASRQVRVVVKKEVR